MHIVGKFKNITEAEEWFIGACKEKMKEFISSEFLLNLISTEALLKANDLMKSDGLFPLEKELSKTKTEVVINLKNEIEALNTERQRPIREALSENAEIEEDFFKVLNEVEIRQEKTKNDARKLRLSIMNNSLDKKVIESENLYRFLIRNNDEGLGHTEKWYIDVENIYYITDSNIDTRLLLKLSKLLEEHKSINVTQEAESLIKNYVPLIKKAEFIDSPIPKDIDLLIKRAIRAVIKNDKALFPDERPEHWILQMALIQPSKTFRGDMGGGGTGGGA